ncbi:MAG: LysM peptidoglycan-binding domain-containing protein, partial [Gemmatimonadota bacterium]|nr:LysM peptidoglycan-binding domain-containing protein [Gemmatimonadota bacterium]
ALVGEEPARYGVRVESLPPYTYDSVRAPGGTPLAAVANALGLQNAELSEFNPHLLRGMTPPADSMWVRVPQGRAEGFEERFSALEPEERQALTRTESRKGQTMVSIAKAHGITSKQLAWYNPKVAKLKSGALRTGQLILVPRRDVVLLARDVPNPSVERYPRRASSSVRRHKVASGQTLSTIAKKYGVSVPTLMKLNGLKSETLRPGQSLVVSGRASSTARTKSATAKASATKSSKATAKQSTAKKATVKKSTAKKPGTAPAAASAGKRAKSAG